MQFYVFALFLLLLGACESAAVTPPESGVAENTKTVLKSKSGNSAANVFERGNNAGPRNVDDDEATETLIATAEKMRATGDLVSASILYKRAAGGNPESVNALKGLASVSEERKEPRDAIQAWRGLLAIDENNTEARRGLARNFLQIGIYDKAITELEKLRQQTGDDVETLNLLGVAKMRSQDLDGAVSILKQALDKEPENLKTQNNLGFAYISAGKVDEAITVLEKEIDNPRLSAQHRQNLALAYGLAGRENDARKIALQDLPTADVEANIKSYRTMRTHMGRGQPIKHDSAPAKPADRKKEATPTHTENKATTKKEEKGKPAPKKDAGEDKVIYVKP